MRQILRGNILLLLTLITLPATAYNNSSISTIEHCKELENQNKETISNLKKQYNAKVSIEKWNDGNIYYIIQRDGTFARAGMDGKLISYHCYGSSEIFSFFKKFEMHETKTGERYYQGVYVGNGDTIFCLSNGVCVFTVGDRMGDFLSVGGKKYFWLSSGSSNSSFHRFYDMSGKLLTKFPLRKGTFYGTADTASYVSDRNKLRIKFLYPKTDNVLSYTTFEKDKKTKSDRCIYSEKLGNFAVKWSIGNLYSTHFNGARTSDVTLKYHFASNGKIVAIDTVLTVTFPEQVSIMRADNGDTLIYSTNKISFLHNSDKIFYESGSNDIPRNGMISTRDSENSVPPLFNDIYVVGDRTMVRVSALEEFSCYDHSSSYAYSFTDSLEVMLERGLYKDLLFKLDKKHNDSNSSLTAKDRQILSSAYYNSIGQDLAAQYNLVGRLENDANNLTSVQYTTEPSDSSLNCSISDNILFYAPMMQYIKDNNSSPDSLLFALATNNEVIDSEYILYKQRKQEQAEQRRIKNEELAKQRQIEQQKRERLRKALEGSKKNREFLAEIQKYQSIVQAGQQRSSSGSTNGSATGSGASKAESKSNSGGADNSGRKAFLKGQIAEWKNKLKKAEQSYQQALSSGDDTWEKKRVIDSKRNTVDECLNMIREYESELNSLK